MTDQFGVPLNVGDDVIYTTGAQSNTCLEVGTVLEINTEYLWGSTQKRAIIKTATGRRATNSRGQYELISLNPHKAQHPELFI
jgi:hypothetical protein